MSAFYGSVLGNRGMATRCGSKDSGIRASAQSWDGSVIVHLYEDEGETWAEIQVAEGSSTHGRILLDVPISKLKLADRIDVTYQLETI